MQVIKHRKDESGALMFSVVGTDLSRLHVVAARLDLSPHKARRVHWRAVWLPVPGVWQISYLIKGRRFQDFDTFEKQYAAARRAVQYAEFPGFKYPKLSHVFARKVSEPKACYTLAESPYFKADD